jgi:hypothetical protein
MTPEERREAVRLRVAKHRAKKREGAVPLSMAERLARMQAGRQAAGVERARVKAAALLERAAAQAQHERQQRPAPIAQQVIEPALTAEEYMMRYYWGVEPRPGQRIRKHSALLPDI